MMLAESTPRFGLRITAETPKYPLKDPMAALFPPEYIPSTQMNEIYELKLAMLEAGRLSPEEILDRGGYFLAVKGEPTNHFRICTGQPLKVPKGGSLRLQSFLATHQFKSSYATHGLFPYRGKFHPQMVKGILNIMGLQPGETVLDPMMGSGTTLVEAKLMGIHSVGIDVNPFCVFMTKSKVDGFIAQIDELEGVLQDKPVLNKIFQEWNSTSGNGKGDIEERRLPHLSAENSNLALLAFLDSQGYSRRSQRKSHLEFFEDVLRKYVFAIRKFQSAMSSGTFRIGESKVLEGDARSLEMPDESIDGVLFSPPYSFAVDYLDNDKSQLEFMGYDIEDLRGRMVGLRGVRRLDQVETYFEDMTTVLKEVCRVLRGGKFMVVVIGSNANQLSEALDVAPHSREARFGLELRLADIAGSLGMIMELAVRRLIVGMANTMREEHILFFRKPKRYR